jgi:hypothetical protein
MSNDLMTDRGAAPDLGEGPAGVLDHEVAIARAADGGAPVGPSPLLPFRDAEHAGALVTSCRRLLARDLEPPDLISGTFVVLSAKVLDEIDGFGDSCPRFAPVVAEPRVSASHFDTLARAAGAALAAHGPDPAGVEIPELVAHEVLRQLGPWSITETAARTGGQAVVVSIFAEAFAGADDGQPAELARSLGAALAATDLGAVQAVGTVASAAARAADATPR